MTPARLLLLTPDFPPALGGIQRLLGETATRLAEDGWHVSVIAPRFSGAPARSQSVGYRVRRTRAAWSPRSAPAVLTEMAVVGRREPADVILAGHVLALPSALAAARGRPVAAMAYGSELWAPRGAAVLRRVGRRATRFIAISEFTRRELERLAIPTSRIRVVRPGGDAPIVPGDWHERLLGLGLAVDGELRPFMLTIARLAEPHKGEDVVIRALPALAARYPGLRYVISGDGPLRDHFRRIAVTSGVEEAVVMTGSVDEPTKGALLAGCRALALISREAPAAAQFEGFGIALVEAARAGRAVIAGNSGAIPEVVRDGDTGILVDPRSPVAFAEAASRLIDDPRYAETLGARAKARADAEFTWARSAEGVERVLAELVRR